MSNDNHEPFDSAEFRVSTRRDIDRLQDSTTKAHERIDQVVVDLGDMKETMGNIDGTLSQMQTDIHTCATHLTGAGGIKAGANLMALVVKAGVVLLICSTVVGLALVGFDSFSAQSGDKTIEAQR